MLSKQEEDRERRETLRNDLKVRQQQREQGASFHQFAEADAAIPLGRFTQVNTATVVGGNAVPQYPAASSPWQGPDLVGLEPPTGYRIDAMTPDDPAELSSFPQQATGPTSDDAPSPNPLSDEQRADVGPLSQSGEPMSGDVIAPLTTSSVERRRDVGSPTFSHTYRRL